MTSGERREMEIRGCSIHVCELIRDRAEEILKEDGRKDVEINAILIDFFLWTWAKERGEDMKDIPVHKIRCCYYWDSNLEKDELGRINGDWDDGYFIIPRSKTSRELIQLRCVAQVSLLDSRLHIFAIRMSLCVSKNFSILIISILPILLPG